MSRIASAVEELQDRGYLSEQTLDSLTSAEYVYVLAEASKEKAALE